MSILSVTVTPLRRSRRRAAGEVAVTGVTQDPQVTEVTGVTGVTGVNAVSGVTGVTGVTDARVTATLATMARGQRAAVVAVEAPGDPAGARRLFDLGFVPGAEVQMVRKAPLADPIVFRVAGYEIALRREQACWVSVAALAC